MNIKNIFVLFIIVLSSLCLNASLAMAVAGAWEKCADENGVCNSNVNARVRYGLNGVYVYGDSPNGTVNCNNSTFGDPLPGVGKMCEVYIVIDQNNNSVVSTMCSAMKLVTGSAGKAFAAFAIISVGIGFFTGKVSWGLMIGVAMGIAAMFGAPTIVSALTGNGAFDCG